MLLLITKKLEQSPMGGREMLCKINYDLLSEILGDELNLFELIKEKESFYEIALNTIFGYVDGINIKVIDRIIKLIKIKNITKVFIDGSNLGSIANKIKRNFPNVEIITFYHNVESRFFWGSLKTKKTFRSLAIFLVNYLAERSSTRLSDKRICLSERDSKLLIRIYKKGATHISPIALKDKYNILDAKSHLEESEKFALFVGGSFYANSQGIDWFVKNVVKKINIKILIIGKGMENMRNDLEIPGKVEVVGSVENLAGWYNHARFIIAPIFDGSGMKTKVAEALMFGKKIVGTPEAFSGYEQVVEKAGWLCTSADEFVAAISLAQAEIYSAFNQELRDIYLQNYSFEAAKKRMKLIIL